MKQQTKHIHSRVEEDTYEILLKLAKKKGFDGPSKAGISRIVRYAIKELIRREREIEHENEVRKILI